jgi:AcrR family transcriptional regulator
MAVVNHAVGNEEIDGRRLRRANNRQAVLDAMATLFEDGNLQPSTAEIAAKAGISPRSLFRYFDDLDDLHRATIDRQVTAALPLLVLPLDAGAPTLDKIDGLVQGRIRLHQAVAPAARAARASAHRRPIVAAQVRDARAYLRRQVARLFAPELEMRPFLLDAVDALCSFETYDLMHSAHGSSEEQIVETLIAALRALLGAGR